MKRSILLTVILLASMAIYAQDISGTWNGVLNVQGTKLRIVFNIAKTGSGYNSTMDSPDQGAKGIPVSVTKFENGILTLEIKTAGIQYSGKLNGDKIIDGTFKQAGQSFPLKLSKEKIDKKPVIRPQEQVKPYPYYTENVTFENKKAGVVLAGTLTLPEKHGNFPAVILISGSGPQNRNEEVFGHKPFLVLSDYLTKKGIAVLRYDDRGTAESTGNFKNATTQDFAEDVLSAVKYLKSRKEIDKTNIGLIGHSEGGIIAPIVAAECKDVSFIVLLAGTGIRGDKLLLLQQEAIGKASGISKSELEKDKAINKGAFDIVVNNDNADSLNKKLTQYLKRTFKEYPELAKQTGVKEDAYIKSQIKQLTFPWIIYFLKYNPAYTLKKVKCPVLALNGEKDLQVPAKVNLDAIKAALEEGGNKNVTVKELPGLNHMFQQCNTCLPDEYAKIEQTFSPSALKEISSWILKQVKSKRRN